MSNRLGTRLITAFRGTLVSAFNDVTARLKGLSGADKRAEEQITLQLRAAADLASRINAILDPDQLLPEVVEQLHDRFDLYHVHIYLLEQETRELRLRAGYGEPGQAMLERGHSIPLSREKSLVARAARERKIVLSNDIRSDLNFMSNPLLPDTRSEVAVPLVVGERVLGVFDVQDDEPERFTPSDLDTFSTLAGQIATALQNARLFADIQARLRVSQALAVAQTEEEVLDAMIQVAGFYPQALVAIFSVDQEAEELTVIMRRFDAFESGVTPVGSIGARYSVSQFTMLQLACSGPFVSPDLLNDERADPASRALAERIGFASVCVLPITLGDEHLGVIVAESRQVRFFGERRMRLYQSLAEQGATALHAARLRAEVQRSVAQFRAFAQAADYGFGMGDLKGNLIFVNPALARMFGEESYRDALGKNINTYHPPQVLEKVRGTVIPTMLETGKWEGELPLLSRQGELTPTWHNVFLIYDETGAPQYFANVVTDISERVQAEEALRRERARTDELYAISRQLNEASNEQELLQVLAQPGIQAGADVVSLQYVDLDEAGEPEWLELVATWRRQGEPILPVGTRNYVPDFPFFHLWFSSPDEPLLITDVATDERVDENTRNILVQVGLRAMANIPMVQAGLRRERLRQSSVEPSAERRWIGVLNILWDAPHEFSEQEMDIYRAIVGLATSAVANRRLLVEQERALTETLYRISSDLNKARDEDELVRALAQPAIEAGATSASLMYVELDQAGQPAWMEKVAGWQREGALATPLGMRFYLPEFSIFRLWIENPGEPLLVADVADDERSDERTKAQLSRLDMRAMAVVPLSQAGRWVGAIHFAWSEPHPFGQQEAETYRALIGLASPAVASRRAFELTQIARDQAETLYGIGHDLNAARDEYELLLALIWPAMQVGASQADLFYLDLDQAGQPEWMEKVATWHVEDEPKTPVGTRYYLPDFAFTQVYVKNPDEPQLVSDVATDERLDDNTRDVLTRLGTRAFVIIPLSMGGLRRERLRQSSVEPSAERRWVGLIIVQWDKPHEFSAQEVEIYRAFIGLGSPAVASRRLMDTLEHMVTERTQQLRTASDIAGQVSAILDPDRLLRQVVDQLQARFELYYVQVYLLDEETHDLVIQAGSGEAGRALCEQDYKIPLDHTQSLIARAARSREIVLVNDTAAAPDFLPSPLLPETRSELATPLIAGDKLLGVFDVQQDRADHFTSADQDVFNTIAGQISIALENARRFEQAQARLWVGQALIGAQTEEQVLDAMLQVVGLYPQARISIYTFDLQADERTYVLRRDEPFESGLAPEVPIGTHLPVSQLMSFQASLLEAPFVSPNVFDDERTGPESRDMARQSEVVSLAIMPILAGDEWVGIIVAMSKQQGYFDRRKMHLYQSLADQSAIFLRTARLFDETQETAERLREVDRLKNEFMASMSHELRTPLNAIIGFAEVLLMGISGDLPAEAQVDVQAIFDNGQDLLRIINDVLDMAKVEAGSLILNLEPVEIVLLLQEIEVESIELLADKPVGMQVQIEQGLPTLMADPVRVKQIVRNLVSNAVKFTAEGLIALRAFREDDWVCIQVQDSGIGIAKEDMATIFERFRQVDGSHARRAGGTGLGLPITRHLVELHGGTITVQSQPGEGSVFSVRLPVGA
jgi:PAS domain S-box-containing protein